MATTVSTLIVLSNRFVIAEVVPAVVASPDYATGQLMGGLLTLADIVEKAGAGGSIIGVQLANAAVAAGANVDCVFFNDNPAATTFTESAAFAPAAADLAKICGAVALTQHYAFSANSFSQAAAAPALPFRLVGSVLYAALVARATINLAAVNDIKLRVLVERH